jgi:hypothetical protein
MNDYGPRLIAVRARAALDEPAGLGQTRGRSVTRRRHRQCAVRGAVLDGRSKVTQFEKA